MIEAFLDNLRHSLRQLRTSPGFFLGAVLILAIATGGLVATGTAAWSILVKPLSYDNPDQLVVLTAYSSKIGWTLSLSSAMTDELRDDDWHVGIVSFNRARDVEGRGDDIWRSAAIEPGLLQLLGISPLVGRDFSPDDALTDASDVVLLGESAWRSRFDANQNVIGRRIELDGTLMQIVGVVPDSVTMPEPGIEVWMPLVIPPEKLEDQALAEFGRVDTILARLAPGQTPVSAAGAIEARYGNDSRLAPIKSIGLEFQVRPLRERWVGSQRQPLTLLVTAAVAIFLIAVLNLAGLWMARWFKRAHEVAMRTALGAGRWQPVRTSAGEFALAVLFGLALGLILARAGIHALYKLEVLSATNPLTVDLGVAGLLLAVSLAVVAAVPVLMAVTWQTRGLFVDPASVLGTEGRGMQGVGRRSRRVLLIGQIAIAISLIVVTGLLVMSWTNLLNEDLGFEPERLVMAQIRSGPDMTDPTADDERLDAAIQRLADQPGIAGVSFAQVAPFSWMEIVSSYEPPGQPGDTAPMRIRPIGPDYFNTVGTPILAGRVPEPTDTIAGSNRVVVDELFAERHFPEGNAVGQRFLYGSGPAGETSEAEIAAVARSTRHMAPNEELSMPTIYFFPTKPQAGFQVLARTRIPADQMLMPVRALLEEELGPDRVSAVDTAMQRVEQTIADRRPQMVLLGAIAALATGLVAVGLYALMSYSARARIPELGLRLALGAAPLRSGLSILGDGLKLLLLGLIPGLALAWLGTRLVADRLYQVSAWQPMLWACVIGLLALILLIAGLRPAIMAMRIEPMDALRQE